MIEIRRLVRVRARAFCGGTAIRAWRRAGFVDVEERQRDDEHTSQWLLMELVD